MALTHKQIAADLAPELDRLIEAYLNGGMVLGSPQHTELEGFLWDNKVGILGVLKEYAKGKGRLVPHHGSGPDDQ